MTEQEIILRARMDNVLEALTGIRHRDPELDGLRLIASARQREKRRKAAVRERFKEYRAAKLSTK